MDILTIIATSVGAGSAFVSTIVAIYIARLTAKTIKAYNLQIQIGQDQVKATQEQTFNQARPALIPPADLDHIVTIDQGRTFVHWGQNPALFKELRNIGVGPAFNIYGVIFGPPFQNIPPRERYSIWNYGFLSPGGSGREIMLSQGTSLKSETTISGHVLYVPDDEDHIGCIARLTLTYHDLFGRKFASMYDYHPILKWIYIGQFEGIEYDLYELDQQEPMTQMSNQTFYQMGKIHP